MRMNAGLRSLIGRPSRGRYTSLTASNVLLATGVYGVPLL